jgi:hypothetical protein
VNWKAAAKRYRKENDLLRAELETAKVVLQSARALSKSCVRNHARQDVEQGGLCTSFLDMARDEVECAYAFDYLWRKYYGGHEIKEFW